VSSTPRVVIWRDVWLPRSETFVRDQMAALTRWEPVQVGVKHLDDGLPVDPVFAPLPGWWPGLAIRAFGSRGVQRAATRAVERTGAVLLHAHFGPSAVHALPVARAAGLPMVVTFHGYDVTRTPYLGYGQGLYYRRRLARVFDYADRLLAVSEFIAERVLALGAPEHKVEVRHIGIPIRSSQSGDGAGPVAGPVAAPVAAPVAGQRSGVTFVGRLVEKKGVGDLLEAYATLPAALRDQAPLRVAGMGAAAESLRARARHLGIDVDWLGYRTSDEVAQLLASSRVFCAPSRRSRDGDSEGFGMVFLEAALHGAPVVTYRHGGVPEAVLDGTTGLLAPEGDVAALARQLEWVLTDDALARKLGEAGRARVLAEFDIRGCTAALEDVYDEVSARRPADR